jgi:peptide/nickel transport system substrate-binding protein
MEKQEVQSPDPGSVKNNQSAKSKALTRRRFVALAGTAIVGGVTLVACGDATPTPATTTVAATKAATAVASAATAAAAGAPKPGGKLVYGLGGVVDSLDPQVANFDRSIRVLLHVCEPLIWEPEPGKFQPALAESWDISPDGKVYTFKLRKGVKFHDGTPFNADAVKYTFDRVVNEETKAGQSSDQLGPYDSAEVVDDLTVKIKMKQAFAPLLTGLNGYMGIVSPTAVKKAGLAEFAKKPVGTGPYMVKEYVENDHITLVKNPDYNWGSTAVFGHSGPAYLDELTYRIIPEGAVRLAALRNGEVQYIEDVPPTEVAKLKGDNKFSVIEKPYPGSGWTVLVNQTKTIGQDAAFRQAIEFGTDKASLNKVVWQGVMATASSPLSKVTQYYDPATEKVYNYDPAKAKKILDDAGWKPGSDGIRVKDGQRLQCEIVIRPEFPFTEMSQFLQANWKDLGIDLKITSLARAAASEKVKKNEYDISYMWFSAGDADVLRFMFSKKGSFNRAKYDNADVEKLLSDAAAETDPKKRQDLYAQIQSKVLTDAVVVPLIDDKGVFAKRAELKGDKLDALASYPWFYDAYLEK